MSFAKRKFAKLSLVRNLRVASEATSELVLDFLESLDCPRSLTVYMLFKYSEHEQLADLVCDPLAYRNVSDFRDAYAASKFLSKYKDLSLGYDLDDVALTKFNKFELGCKHTNSRFKDLGADPLFNGPVVWLHNAVKRKIAQILGEISAEEIFELADWGPGASTLIKRRDASSAKKFQHEAGITRDLHSLIPSACLEVAYPLWYRRLSENGFPNYQIGNKIVTVPKDATANRVIAIEPGINLWFQLAIGKVIQRRLLRFGIDLRDQVVNQEMARRGSIDSYLATIDFSSASDSISTGIVEELLPPRWFLILDSARSRYGFRGETLVKWEKFSSMGNGFTFPLESLIFFATALCCLEYLQISPTSASGRNLSVYGDDVVIPVRCLELFSLMSAFYGFTLNRKKSHFSSEFRESCGAYFMRGVNVKPIYLKGKLSDVTSVFRLANAVRRLSHRFASRLGCDTRFQAMFDHCVALVPKSLRFRISDQLGDGGLISNFDEATPVRARHCIEGYFVEHVVFTAKRRESEIEGLLLDSLWVPLAQSQEYILEKRYHTRHAAVKALISGSRERGNSLPLMDRVDAKITRSLVPQWYDLGPWV